MQLTVKEVTVHFLHEIYISAMHKIPALFLHKFIVQIISYET